METKAGDWWFFKKNDGKISVGRVCKLISRDGNKEILAAIIENDDSDIGFTTQFTVIEKEQLLKIISLTEEEILEILAWRYLEVTLTKININETSVEEEQLIRKDFQAKILIALSEFK